MAVVTRESLSTFMVLVPHNLAACFYNRDQMGLFLMYQPPCYTATSGLNDDLTPPVFRGEPLQLFMTCTSWLSRWQLTKHTTSTIQPICGRNQPRGKREAVKSHTRSQHSTACFECGQEGHRVAGCKAICWPRNPTGTPGKATKTP